MDWITNLREQVPGMRPQARQQDTRRPWCQIRNAAGDTAEVLIYDEISDWWGVCAEDVVYELRAITAPNILVRLNSPGGSVFEGLAIANALRAHPASVTVQVDGLAASIASVIALAGDRLVMAPNSMLMIHEASGGCLGNAADMQQMAGLLDKISDNIASAYASKAGGDAADWRAMMLAETWYTADEAVAAGLADEVTAARAADGDDEPETMRAAWDLSVFRYAGREAAPAPANVAPKAPQRVPAQTLAAAIASAPPAATAAASVLVDADAQRIGEAVLAALGGQAPTKTAPPAPGEGPAPEEQPTDTAPETAVTDPSPDPVDTPSDAPVAAAPSSDDDPSTPVTDQAAPDGAADGWAAMVAHLTAPSPGADDVFRSLKEALL